MNVAAKKKEFIESKRKQGYMLIAEWAAAKKISTSYALTLFGSGRYQTARANFGFGDIRMIHKSAQLPGIPFRKRLGHDKFGEVI